jgi:hypothetical protein
MATMFVYQYNGDMYVGETEAMGDPMDAADPATDLNQLYQAEIDGRAALGGAGVNENYAILRTITEEDRVAINAQRGARALVEDNPLSVILCMKCRDGGGADVMPPDGNVPDAIGFTRTTFPFTPYGATDPDLTPHYDAIIDEMFGVYFHIVGLPQTGGANPAIPPEYGGGRLTEGEWTNMDVQLGTTYYQDLSGLGYLNTVPLGGTDGLCIKLIIPITQEQAFRDRVEAALTAYRTANP